MSTLCSRLTRALRTLAALPAFWLAGAGAAPCPPAPAPPDAAQLRAAQAQDRGLLWRLERDGRSSFLYGTVHVGKPEWQTPGPQVAAALARSTVLALEIDPGAPGAEQALAAAARGADTALPEALRARLARQVAAACLPEGTLGTLHPALQVVALTLLEARWLGLDPAYAQEAVLARRARAAGQRVVALESVVQQAALLLPADAAAARAQIEQALTQLEDGSGRAMLARMTQAWATGDLATLEDHPRWCQCVRNDEERAAMRALNDERNPALADGIAALHREGHTVFAAVGALHMTGPAALPRLLAARGFRVERVPLQR
jgi:uncharacterized protein YbaP (TraB family)